MQVQNQLKRVWLNLFTKKPKKNYIIHVSTSSGEGYKNVAGIFPNILEIIG